MPNYYPVTRLKDALRRAEKCGCKIRHSGGEAIVQAPTGGRTLRVNVRKKDAPLELMKMLAKIA